MNGWPEVQIAALRQGTTSGDIKVDALTSVVREAAANSGNIADVTWIETVPRCRHYVNVSCALKQVSHRMTPFESTGEKSRVCTQRQGVVHVVFASRRGVISAVRALIDALAAGFKETETRDSMSSAQ